MIKKLFIIAITLYCNLPLSAAEPVFQINASNNSQTVLDNNFGLIEINLYLEVSKPVSDEDWILFEQFENKQFKLMVNGQEKSVTWRGSGNGSTETTVYQDKELAFSPGTEAGAKKIEVVFGNMKREVTIDYWPVTRLTPIGLCDNMAIFNTDRTCTFVATNIKSSQIAAIVNDDSVSGLQAQSLRDNDNLVQLVIPAKTYFKRGRNQVRITAKDNNGIDTDCRIILYYYPADSNQEDNDKIVNTTITDEIGLPKTLDYKLMTERLIPLGDEFLVEYGYPGGKSGPWFGCSVEGEAVKILEYFEETMMPWHINEFGVVYLNAPQFVKVKAVKPGAGRILFYETPHFTMPEELKQEIPVMVIEPIQPAAIKN